MSYLETEINQQPQVLAKLIDNTASVVAEIGEAFRANPPRFTVMAARGSSDNAARYAQYLFGEKLGQIVALSAPSLFSLGKKPPLLARSLVVGVSQSGRSPDVVSVIKSGNAQGALTIAITNDASSPIAKAAHYTIELGCGVEKSVAATKTYTASLGAIALIAAQSLPDKSARLQALEGLKKLPPLMDGFLNKYRDKAAQTAQNWPTRNRAVVLGRGYDFSTAYEIALKIKELTYVSAEPYSPADFKHGPMAIVEPGFPVMAVGGDSGFDVSTFKLAELMKARGANVLLIGAQNSCDIVLPSVPAAEHNPFVSVLFGQMLAAQSAKLVNDDIDKPRGLSKVTLTT